MKIIDLSGIWNFQLDQDRTGYQLPFKDTIALPGTTSLAKKGPKNEEIDLGYLTEEYKYEGLAWYEREIEFESDIQGKKVFLHLERTRITKVYLDGVEIGTQNSLNTPHTHELSDYVTEGKHRLAICVENTNYPTKGGHMTSPDTQTNWNGITGKIELHIAEPSYIGDVQVYPSVADRSVTLHMELVNTKKAVVRTKAISYNSEVIHEVREQVYEIENSNEVSLYYSLGEEALLWSEYHPALYRLDLSLEIDGVVVDQKELSFGLRDFKARGDKFTINGVTTFLRGKHDGLLFPRTGHAPTTVEEWVRILNIAKDYGINHYRFHTCCPPNAAFTAADLLGIYMEPELPFWGTVTDENDENHNQAEQDYLIREGFLMLKHFGNHPSFVMISLGNELWGSKERINHMLKGYKEYDSRHLYTQGSNNFQHVPDILDQEDFFCGVRCSKTRLFRGSFAQCDAPLGHVQTDEPSTMKDYDEIIHPSQNKALEDGVSGETTIQIQYGTGAKTVKADGSDGVVPQVPVVSHEIGQYETFPNFDEIDKYTGPLKARNFEVFRERLVEKKLDHLAKDYFEASGKLAVECYKEELEAAFRSRSMAGFQILDLQDFTGQGTALVGVLDSFMESKGTVTAEDWRSFCSDAVLMARFPKYNYESGEIFEAHVELTHYRQIPTYLSTLRWTLWDGDQVCASDKLQVEIKENVNYIDLCDIKINIPSFEQMKKLTLSLSIDGTDIRKEYCIWVYPAEVTVAQDGLHIVNELSEEAMELLEQGENVVFIPSLDKLTNALNGFYCTDFWCYPMFRTISEWMKKDVGVGTMGLLIDQKHPIFKHFDTEKHSTYQWWSIVMNSKSVILDGTPRDLQPMVQTIDNFERNHKLGLLFECKVGKGNLLVCNCDVDQLMEKVEGKQFLYSVFEYVRSSDFNPSVELEWFNLVNLMK